MNAHTPGPWAFARNRGGFLPCHCVLIPNAPLAKSEGYTNQVLKLGKTEEDEANARLIAAAPELLAALDKIEATAVNLHCALQSTAHMDPNDSRISVITGRVVRDLLVMRDEARTALAVARSPLETPLNTQSK